MTSREMLTAVINGTITAEVVEAAKAEIAKLDARNGKRRNTLTKEQIANEAIKADIVAALSKPMVASEIAIALGISTQKVSALCKQLVDNGEIKVADIKVKGKGSVKQYELAG